MKNLWYAIVFLSLTACVKHPDVSGVWETNWGKMEIQQKGKHISGSYDYMEGRIEGSLQNQTLHGTWIQPNGEGTFVFEFNESLTEFTGSWGYDDDPPSRNWDGSRPGK